MEGKANLNQMFFSWWYVEAYSKILAFLKYFYSYLADLFSVRACLRTLFYPWKRDQLSYEGLGLADRFRTLLLNLISRLVGAVIKLFTLATFFLVIVIWTGFVIAVIFFWFAYPLCLVAIAAYGIKIMISGV